VASREEVGLSATKERSCLGMKNSRERMYQGPSRFVRVSSSMEKGLKEMERRCLNINKVVNLMSGRGRNGD